MIDKFVTERLAEIVGSKNILTDEPMKNHTTFKIGGACDILVLPDTKNAAVDAVRFCRENDVRYMVIGNGSNLLVSDNGYRGVIIKLLKNLSEIKCEGCTVTAQAGAVLSGVSALAAQHSLSGLEFASGIPGTVGGAVMMNAGAYGGEMKDVVTETEYLSQSSEILKTKEHGFSYRNSIFQKNGGIVLEVTMMLKEGKREEIDAEIKRLTQARRTKQPLSFPSAGSAFKRPQGYFAAKLIDDAGLRGYTVGGAQVSQLHTGFVINRGGATAQDVLRLLDDVRDKVYEKFGVVLEREIKYIGE